MEPKTIADVFWNGVELRRPDRFLQNDGAGYRAISTDEFREMVVRLASGLESLGVRKGDRVALIAYNSVYWAATDFAAQVLGAILVPLYTTLTDSAVEFILNDCGATVVVVEDSVQLAKVLASKAPAVRHVIAFKGDAMPWKEVRGTTTERQLRAKAADLGTEDLSTIIYTSGTTGTPKGVMLSHRNVVSNMTASQQMLTIVPEDLLLSFLPLCHVFERMVDWVFFASGGAVAYATGINDVAQNMRDLRPTIVPGVPRFYEKMHAAIMEAVCKLPPKRQKMFAWAVDLGREYSRRKLRGEPISLSLAAKHSMADFLVLRKLRARAGGRVRYFLSGSAALSPELAEFLFACGFTVLEGYGLSETSPVVSVNPIPAPRPGTVGKVVQGVEVKIAADGEILVRGPNVMVGYYNQPEETAAMIRDGWLYTGDIGEFDADGYLKITDRKKDLFKTSGGKYVAPQPMENQLKRSPFVLNAVVLGAGRKFPSCLIVPNLEAVKRAADEKGIAASDPDALLRHPEVQKLFDDVIACVNQPLSQPERIKKWSLLREDFSLERGEVTPTMKIRRKVIEERYRTVIEELYKA